MRTHSRHRGYVVDLRIQGRKVRFLLRRSAGNSGAFQSADKSTVYNFDSDTVGSVPAKFHSEPKANGQ